MFYYLLSTAYELVKAYALIIITLYTVMLALVAINYYAKKLAVELDLFCKEDILSDLCKVRLAVLKYSKFLEKRIKCGYLFSDPFKLYCKLTKFVMFVC